jgi:predicted secreted protein
MATQKQFLDVAQSELEIDLGEISFMRRNGRGTDITLNTGQTLTVRESPKVICKAAITLLVHQVSRRSG